MSLSMRSRTPTRQVDAHPKAVRGCLAVAVRGGGAEVEDTLEASSPFGADWDAGESARGTNAGGIRTSEFVATKATDLSVAPLTEVLSAKFSTAPARLRPHLHTLPHAARLYAGASQRAPDLSPFSSFRLHDLFTLRSRRTPPPPWRRTASTQCPSTRNRIPRPPSRRAAHKNTSSRMTPASISRRSTSTRSSVVSSSAMYR